MIVVGFPLLVKVSETMAKLLALPSGGAVAANAPQLYVRDSRETSPRLSSKAGFFRPNLDSSGGASRVAYPDLVRVVVLSDGMVLNLLW